MYVKKSEERKDRGDEGYNCKQRHVWAERERCGQQFQRSSRPGSDPNTRRKGRRILGPRTRNGSVDGGTWERVDVTFEARLCQGEYIQMTRTWVRR